MRDRIGNDGVRPALIAFSGRVASGKSSVARALSRSLKIRCIVGDDVRESVLEAPGDSLHEVHWSRGFEPGFEERVYAELLRRAEREIRDGRPVVLDACFPRRAQRLATRAIARRCGVPFLLVECRADEATLRARLAARDAESDHAGWQAIHDDLEAHAQPIDELADDEHLVVATDGTVAEAVSELLATPILGRLAAGDARRPMVSTRPELVTFDCWNTLLYEDDWETAHALRVAELRAAAHEAGRAVSPAEAARAFDVAWGRHMRGWVDGYATGAREVARWGLAELGLEEPHPALERLVAIFEEASHSSRVRALDGAAELLSALRRAGIRCALVCDTGLTPGRVVRGHLDHQGLLADLAVQAFSDEVGAPKPDPRAFRAALDPLGVAPERAMHVGDLRRTDVAGARALGMTSVRIRARHDDLSDLPDADHVVDSHAALAQLLGLADRNPSERGARES